MLKPSTGLLSQVMNLYPLTLNAHTPVTDAIAQMSQTQASCALIEKDGRLVGLFAEQDVVQAVAAGKVGADIAIATVMNRNV
ncbi:MAG: CBS domain-containing protein, partial [Coleofasciculus sp. S288]|nr:CBS domain-containing protein [Coleofasciculus sp. S288]